MGTISDGAFSRGDILREIKDIKRQLRELAAARRLEASTIGAGGLTIKGGALRVLDDAGRLVAVVGALDDGSHGVASINDDGEMVKLATLSFGLASDSEGGVESTSSISFTDLATVGPTVEEVEIGSSRRCLVIVTARISGDTFNGSMSFEVSGASTFAAATTRAVTFNATGVGAKSASTVVLLDASMGLNEGSHTFVAKYISQLGTTTFANRNLTVLPF